MWGESGAMHGLAWLFLAIGTLIPLWFHFTRKSVFHPISIYILMQAIPIGIAHFNPTGQFDSLASVTWIVLALSFIAFVLGSLLTSLLYPPSLAEGSADRIVDGTRLIWALFLLTLGYGFAMTMCAIRIGGLPLMLPDPTEARERFIGSRFGNLFFSQFIAIASLFSVFLVRKDLRPSRLFFAHALLFAASFLVYLMTGNRGFLITWFTFVFAFYDLSVKPIQFSKVLAAFFALIATSLVVGYFRYGREMMGGGSISLKAINPLLSFAGHTLYAYICNGLWNLDFALQKAQDGLLRIPTWGFSSLQGLWDILAISDPLQKAYSWDSAFNESVMKHRGLNSTYYQWAIYKDFGMAGIALVPFAAGASIQWLFEKARSKSIYSCILYSHFIYYVLAGSNILVTVIANIIYGTAGLWLCLRFASRPSPQSSVRP